MAATARDHVVTLATPMPDGYTYVPKGSPYMTLNCRRKAHEEGCKVYVVCDSKKRTLGIRVPISIFKRVEEKCQMTKDARARALFNRDRKLEAKFSEAIQERFTKIPSEEVSSIVEQSMAKHSGRVGRTGTLDIGKKAQLAVRAHIRHKYTNYDELLKNDVPKDEARAQIYDEVDRIVMEWGGAPAEPTDIMIDYSADEADQRGAQKALKCMFATKSRVRYRKGKDQDQNMRSTSAPPESRGLF